MCGISAAVTLKRRASVNGHGANGHNGTNGTNGHNGVNGTNGPNGTNGHGANGTNGHGTNGTNGHKTNGTNGTNGHGTNGTNGTNGRAVNGHSKNVLRERGMLHSQLQDSLEAIAHRGPDASGIWTSDDGKIGLGHCRLAINDLSDDGIQPLHSDDGKIHAVVNGEIYDHDAIRERCIEQGYKFKGHCDSEVLVALYKIHGTDFFQHLRGEFSFVIYDERDGRVIVARDRFGIKPMFWTIQDRGGDAGKRILFTSEIKGFRGLGWEPEWNVYGVLSGMSMQGDQTVFRDVYKLQPGFWMEIDQDGEIKQHLYWDPDFRDKNLPETRTADEMIEGVREHLIEAVKLRLRADVPVGIYLSGGIDSSVVAGIVTKLVREEGVKLGNQDATKRITCFTIQFPEASGFNESDIAERSAEWLGVQILKKDMNETVLANNFADTVYHSEHQFFDLNSVGKFCLSMVPREHGVPVVLTGEGADEHFAGYPFLLPSYLMETDKVWPQQGMTEEVRVAMYQEMTADLAEMFGRIGMFEDESTSGVPNAAMRLEPEWSAFSPWVRDTYKPIVNTILSPEVLGKMTTKWHSLHTGLYIYTKGPLANMILTCLGDRTEMAHSIEARPPFLDHHLVEYVNNLPPSVKVAYLESAGQSANGDGTAGSLWWKDLSPARQKLSEKWILKEAGKPFITQELYERRKHPYSAPVKWPRGGPIHRKLEELLSEENVDQLGFLEHANVRRWMEAGFGDDASPRAFRKLICAASWVVLSQRFGIKKAAPEDFAV